MKRIDLILLHRMKRIILFILVRFLKKSLKPPQEWAAFMFKPAHG